ncbi:MAG: choice-of-anchor J domain-containing protein [Bacteroidales bacterium]|nr:choice-of-anchor J domain-containing protein [Bacteroidales bacterium]
MRKKLLYLALMLMPIAALALKNSTTEKVANFSDFLQQKAETAVESQSKNTPAKIRLNVPHKLAYAWATRERSGKKGLVSFYLDQPQDLTLLFEMENSAFAGTHGTGTDYFFYRYRDNQEEQTFEPIAFSKVNIATGEVTDVASWRNANFICNDMTYDFSTGKIYAMCRTIYHDDILSYDVEYSAILRVDPKTGSYTEVKSFLQDYSGFTNPIYLTLAADMQGNLYSVTNGGVLVKFDTKNNFEEQVIGVTGLSPGTYIQSMEFDHSTSTLYWQADFSKTNSVLAMVNTTTGKASTIGEAGNDARLAGIYVPFNTPAYTAPGAPGNVKAIADKDGALKATVTWTNPTRSFGGQLIGNVQSVSVKRNGEVIKVFNGGAPGEEMVFTDENAPAAGMTDYTVFASNGSGEGMNATTSVWVGHDIPAEVTKLGITNTKEGGAELTWEAPTTGAHGGYIDAASLTYKVTRMPDAVVVAEGVNECKYVDNSVTAIGEYYYIVTSRTADGEGDSSRSASMFVGSTATYPYTCNFKTQAEFMSWYVIDNNGDGSTWKYKEQMNKGYAMYGYNNKNAGDDYLISPDLYMKKGNTYMICFNYKGANATYTEKFELTFGKEKSAESQSTVVKQYEFKSGDLTSSGMITLPAVEESGIYHVAFHATSDKAMYNIYISDVEITEIKGQGGGGDDEPLTAPFNLKAKVNGAFATLSWNNKEEEGGVKTDINEGFDTYADWERNPAGNYGWTYIDADGGIPYYNLYGTIEATFPGAKIPCAAVVCNPANINSTFLEDNPPASGDKYLMFRNNAADSAGNRPAPKANDYFISPRLAYGKPFVFSFYAKADPDSEEEDPAWKWNKEEIRVGYSTTGNAADDFIWLTGQNEVVTSEWGFHSYTIPADAKYVCINYCTPECGSLMCLDNVFIGTGTPMMASKVGAKAATFQYFNIYLNDELVGRSTENSFRLKNLAKGDYTAKVTAQYQEGESKAAEVTFTINVLHGDVNGDGEVNVSDVTSLINKILGTGSYTDEVCDINGDGNVDVSDVTALINKILLG